MGKKKKTVQEFEFKLTTTQLWILTGLVALGYALFSLLSDGFYQHDEAAHYLNMRRFWHDPSVILGNWAKPGYKLIFVPFSLLGPAALVVVNSIVAALSCFMAYKLAEQLKMKIPLLAFLFLLFQPLWLQLSFRNYSEIVTAFLLVSSVYAHHKSKYWIAALLLSYTATIRQEMYPIIALYGVFLLYNKNWKPALLLAVFPILQNMAGWASSGDPLYLPNMMLGTSANIADAYPRQGGDHYFKMSLTIFGGLSLTFFLAYFAQNIFNKKKWHWFIVIPVVLYFLMHVAFNIQSMKIGPATGGNLRYLVVISPLMAVLAGIASERVLVNDKLIQKRSLFFLLVPFVILVLLFMSYSHNNIKFTTDKNFVPFLTVLLSVALIIPNLKYKQFIGGVVLVGVVSLLLTVEPYPRTSEDQMAKQFADWAVRNDIEQRPVLLNHTMVYYFLGQPQEDFENGAQKINETSVGEAEIGTYIIWDSHYSYRPNLREGTLTYTYFLERPEQFRMVINPMLTPDQRFGIFMFEKIAEAPSSQSEQE